VTTVGAYEAKTHLPRLLEQVEAGETITITKHGREVAKLVPVSQRSTKPDEVIAALRAARGGVPPRSQLGPPNDRRRSPLMQMVIDTSVTMAWCFEDEATDDTDAVLDQLQGDEAVVPPLWQLEVTNVLLVAERRARITEAQATRFLDLLLRLPIRVDVSQTDVPAVLAAGRRHGLSAYDAAYLVLAERLAAPLATLDHKLITASRNAGVPLLIGN